MIAGPTTQPACRMWWEKKKREKRFRDEEETARPAVPHVTLVIRAIVCGEGGGGPPLSSWSVVSPLPGELNTFAFFFSLRMSVLRGRGGNVL